MPRETITPSGLTRNGLKTGTSYSDVRSATAAASVADDNKLTLNAKAGSNYYIRRGIIVLDFTASPLSTAVKIKSAKLIISDTIAAAGTATGDSIRIAYIHNPNTLGTIHVNDYNQTRTNSGAYTSAQTVANGADDVEIVLDNPVILKKLQKAINSKSYLHLMARNQLDYANTAATAGNSGKVWFDGIGDSFNDDLELQVVYSINENKQHAGGSTAGKNSSDNFRAGTKSVLSHK